VRECLRCGAVAEDAVASCPHDGTPLVPGVDGPLLIAGKYRLERRLGAGAMGVVYSAIHESLHRRFAVKLLSRPKLAESNFRERFRVEAEALGALDHPGIVRVTDFGVDPRGGGLPHLVMEYLEGATLEERCRGSAWPLEPALALLERLADALDYAHRRGILHRDLKTTNVMLGRDARGDEVPRILDFGLARIGALAFDAATPHTASESAAAAAPSSLTATGSLVGTLPYMAPEILASGEASRASDLYAFGVLAYRVLTGALPFEGEAAQVVEGHLTLPPPRPSTRRRDLPPELDAALCAPLAKDPRRRPSSAGELVAALRRGLDAARTAAWRRRERPRRLALAVALAATAGLLLPWLRGIGPLERASLAALDWQLEGAPETPPDPAILTVVLDEPSLGGGAPPFSQQDASFATALDGLFAAGARGVGVDLLLPARWSRSAPFASALLRHGDRLTLGAFSGSDGHVVGPEAVSPLVSAALGPGRAAAMFGLLNLEADRDGVVRRGRLAFDDVAGARRASFAAAALRRSGLVPARPTGDRFWLDRTVSWRRLPRVAWRDLPAMLEKHPERVRDRLVLIGGDFAASGEDAHALGPRDPAVPGLLVHSLSAATLHRGTALRDAPVGASVAAVALLTFLLAATTMLSRRLGALAAALVVLAALQGLVSWVLLRRLGLVADAVGPVMALFAATLLALGLRLTLPPIPTR
jgi:CHASE2 domain-containing sensor protein/tRNA A-37 threonylcarbamoyl transferase component Bud32